MAGGRSLQVGTLSIHQVKDREKEYKEGVEERKKLHSAI